MTAHRRAFAFLPVLLAAAAVATSVVAAVPSTAAPASTSTLDVYLTEQVPTGSLREPVGATAWPVPGTSRLMVHERAGTIRRYDVLLGRMLRGDPYVDLRSVVRDTSGEQGLLGLAFDPAFASGRPYVYVAYVRTDGALQVSRLTAQAPGSWTVSASTRRDVLTVPHPTYPNHNGGQLMFGQDGYLYIGTGDGGGGGDPLDNARDRTSLSGKILRIDVTRSCSGQLFCPAPTNPWATSTTYRPEIFLYGLRNPWRFSQDRATGTLWIADVGQNEYEEVTTVSPSSSAHDLGWPCREANAVYDPSRCGTAARVAPRLTYSHAVGQSVTGGYVYRGRGYPELAGRYVFADFVSGRVFVTSGSTYRAEATVPRITAFGETLGGELFALTYDGALWRVRTR
ncbi:MAG: PQQ-dependent sugar dehydrogenase [Angustibacter sp.]